MLKVIAGMLALACVYLSAVYAGDGDVEARSKALAHYIMAVSCDLNGDSGQAIDEYKASIASDSQESQPHLRLASYYARAGLLDQGVRQSKIVLNLDPGNTQAHYLLALIYSGQKKYDLAAAEYEGVLKTASQNNPQSLEIYEYLAQLYYSQGKYPQAVEEFNRILAIEPQNASANYMLGACYLETHERARAADLFKRVLTIEPDQDEALNSLAYMGAEDGVNLDDALKMARKAVAIDPANGAYYDTLGWVLFKKGLNTEALLVLQKAERYVKDPLVYEHMGDVYQAAGEPAQARTFWRKSLALESRQPLVQAKIDGLEKIQALKTQP